MRIHVATDGTSTGDLLDANANGGIAATLRLAWPSGYVARSDGGTREIVDPSGSVVVVDGSILHDTGSCGRTGDIISLDGPPFPSGMKATWVHPQETPTPAPISCQPYDDTPTLIAFSFPAGPVTSSSAEQTAVALFRACAQFPGHEISNLTSTSKAATGAPNGPNDGQSVWLVFIGAKITESTGTSYGSHFQIEVNQATGVPTVIAYG